MNNKKPSSCCHTINTMLCPPNEKQQILILHWTFFVCACYFCECQNDELEWELEKGFNKMIQGDDGKGWLPKVFQECFVHKWYFKSKLIEQFIKFDLWPWKPCPLVTRSIKKKLYFILLRRKGAKFECSA